MLTVLFLVFNEGYLASRRRRPVRAELTAEAIRLTRILRRLLPEEQEVAGLLGLLLLTEARREGARAATASWSRWTSRTAPGGIARWSPRATTWCAVPRGQPARSLPDPGRHQRRPHRRPHRAGHRLVAGGRAVRPADAVDPSPIVALNRAVAVAELDGPGVASRWSTRLGLTGYHAWHAIRADLLRRLGRSDEAKAAYDAAIAATENSAERAYLSRKRGELV